MRIFEVSLYVDGVTFDIAGFQRSLPRNHRGMVKPIYRMVGGTKREIGKYWRSNPMIADESQVNAAALKQLKLHETGLSISRSIGAERIYLSLAMMPDGDVSRRRVSLTRPVLDRLKALGAEVDMNIPQK